MTKRSSFCEAFDRTLGVPIGYRRIWSTRSGGGCLGRDRRGGRRRWIGRGWGGGGGGGFDWRCMFVGDGRGSGVSSTGFEVGV